MTIEQLIQCKAGATPDGNIGAGTLAAIGAALGCGPHIRDIQAALGVRVDGIMGAVTKRALAERLGVDMAAVVPMWPTQAEVRRGDSMFGAATKVEGKLVPVVPPYPVYYDGKPVKSIRCHQAVAPYLRRILEDVLAAYGEEKIHELGLDRYGGCYNDRSVRGGSALSMHAFGIAFDWAPESNALKQDRKTATLARRECETWWKIWEKYGATSLGRARDYDWMHVQFARLK